MACLYSLQGHCISEPASRGIKDAHDIPISTSNQILVQVDLEGSTMASMPRRMVALRRAHAFAVVEYERGDLGDQGGGAERRRGGGEVGD